MLSYQEVILRLLYYLSRITAILEYRFDVRKQIFLKSRFGKLYIWKWHWLSTGPVGSYTLLSLSALCFNRQRDATGDIVHIEYQIYGFVFFVSAWKCLYNRERLFKLLNFLLRLGKIHQLIFGKPLQVGRLDFLLQFIHGIWLWNSLAWPANWFVYPIIIQNIRFMLQLYLADIAMMLHFKLVKTLLRNLRSFPPNRKASRELYIEYAAQLINLRKTLQKFLWPFLMLRFGLEIGMCLTAWLEFYVIPSNWISVVFFAIQMLCFLNGIRMLNIASRAYQMELQIVNMLYDCKLMDYLLKSETKRNLNLLKVSYELLILTCLILFYFSVGESSTEALQFVGE